MWCEFLPPYSPDINPIKLAFLAMKYHLCNNGEYVWLAMTWLSEQDIYNTLIGILYLITTEIHKVDAGVVYYDDGFCSSLVGSPVYTSSELNKWFVYVTTLIVVLHSLAGSWSIWIWVSMAVYDIKKWGTSMFQMINSNACLVPKALVLGHFSQCCLPGSTRGLRLLRPLMFQLLFQLLVWRLCLDILWDQTVCVTNSHILVKRGACALCCQWKIWCKFAPDSTVEVEAFFWA